MIPPSDHTATTAGLRRNAWLASIGTGGWLASESMADFVGICSQTCGKQFNERSDTMLKRAQYPSDVIALVMLWRLRYELSLRDLVEMFAVRGIVFGYEAVRKWEAKLTPTLAQELRRRRKGRIGCSWYVDETYIKVAGRWCYVDRAIDSSGALLDVLLAGC